MSFFVNLMRRFIPTSPPKIDATDRAPFNAPSDPAVGEKVESQKRGTKRSIDAVAPTAESDRSKIHGTGPHAGKRQMLRRNVEMEDAMAELVLYEDERWRREQAEAHQTGDSFKDALASYTGEHVQHEQHNEMELDLACDLIQADDEEAEYQSEELDEDEANSENEEQESTYEHDDQDVEIDSTFDPVEESSVDDPSSSSRLPATPRTAGKKRPDWRSPQSLRNEKERLERNVDSQTAGWAAEDVKLFRALELRAVQPLVSTTWMRDFPSLPFAYFADDDDQILVRALGLKQNYAANVHGAHALNQLMGVGLQVRDRIFLGCSQRPAETYIKKAIEDYIRWTLVDADIWRRRAYLPLIAIVAASKNTSPMLMQTRLVKKMQKLKRKWQVALHDNEITTPPHLYGILVSHSVMAILAPTSLRDFGEEQEAGLAEPGLKDSIRILAMLDWSEDGQDVWSAFAVAILGVHCRDLLLEALEGRTLKGVKVQGADEIDPDI